MLVGNKIKAIRNLTGMTQQELGSRVGFNPSSADVRIRQYERNKMIPKKITFDKIAATLGVDQTALKAHHIDSELDLMQILFELEDKYGLTVRKEGDKYTLSFNEENESFPSITQKLESWYKAKSEFLIKSNSSERKEADKEYSLWKYRLGAK